MMLFIPFGLLVGAGAAVVAQNLLMARITESSSTVLIALVMNSAVGLAALATMLFFRAGSAGFGEIVGSFRLWSVLPGLLGSFFVFASITGYQRFGAATTIAVIVASQLVFGLLLDAARHGSTQHGFTSVIGATMLVTGAFLVASNRL
ncbi:DMT family transporter [Paraburkholderia rhizosphaerae]|uniref:Transporter family-2 protein n=1 Tax=Paraburkholderia rhizosphaerae TaxID=480658 RepID=A0A4R8LY38_9BURK|nr:DMT family transporter [Paraburkholderia rhizosphaerae]TDY51586.1 transporter family-2 protein [Paraburkholderia rhizosphaerae]